MAPRNTIETEYPQELRLEIASWLLDAVGYDQIRDRLTERGVEHLPHNSSFAAYKRGLEFRELREATLHWRRRAEEKRAIAKAIEQGGGAGALADVAMFEAVDALRELISGGALQTGKDVAKVATAISGLKRTLLADAEVRHKHETREKAEELKAEIAEATGTAKRKLTGEEMIRKLDEKFLGVGAKQNA